jgi:iron(II)-dependent oxidoreductase
MFDRSAALDSYRRNRQRTRALFDLLTDEAYYSRPIALRHPLVFYEGHLPAFSFNTLVRKGLGGASIDPALEALFARGIDPDEAAGPAKAGNHRHDGWPSRGTVLDFAAEADARVTRALENMAAAEADAGTDAVFTILEHESMHHETMLYMWHQVPFEQKRRPHGYAPRVEAPVPREEWIAVPAGCATLGVDRRTVPFGWDNEFPAHRENVAAFSIARHDVTNARFLEFVGAGGYHDARWWRAADWEWVQREGIAHPLFWQRRDDSWYWRGMFDLVPLPPSWPVYVSQAEASAYARWRGLRLPTEAEYQRAAFGSPDGDRPYAWGDAAPSAERGVFDLSSWDPQPAGTHPRGASAWGVEDLVGNGWEWTSSPFGPFPGFQPMATYPEYSADFFDGEHFVMKGGSPATAAEFLRPTFRNWFRARYPYVYATFRCVGPGSGGGP